MKNKLLVFALTAVVFAPAGAFADTVIATEGFVRGGVAAAKAHADGAAETALGTAKSYADTKDAEKQDKIGAGTAGHVITYTGTAGAVGSRAIVSTGEEDTSGLVTADKVAEDIETAVSGAVSGLAQVDWEESAEGSASFIKNKPTLGTMAAEDAGNYYTAAAADGLLAAKQGLLGGGTQNTILVNSGTAGTVNSMSITSDIYSEPSFE